jgi:membrane associated rhomboid family serine protease
MSKIIDDIKYEYNAGTIANRLIYWNIGVFLVSLYFLNFKNLEFHFPDWLALSSNPSQVLKFIWTLISYAFLHNSFWHLFFNMMVLNFAGNLFLTFFNEKQFLGLYILSAIFSGLCFVLGFFLLKKNAPIVGASAAIMAILMATTSYQPLMRIRLMFIGNIKLWHLSAVIILLDIMNVFIENTGGHISHLSGAFFGFLYIQLLKNGIDLSVPITNCINFVLKLFSPSKKTPFKKIQRNYRQTTVKPISNIKIKDKTQEQIDGLLDKISKSGYDSLSAAEKEFLFKAGK